MRFQFRSRRIAAQLIFACFALGCGGGKKSDGNTTSLDDSAELPDGLH